MFNCSLFLIMVCIGIGYIINLINKNEKSNHYGDYRNYYSRNEDEGSSMMIYAEDESGYYPDEQDYEDDLADRWGPMH